jgi:hypothetical protein
MNSQKDLAELADCFFKDVKGKKQGMVNRACAACAAGIFVRMCVSHEYKLKKP